MKPRRLPADLVRRWRGWLIPAALLALTPKCVFCLLAYAGLGGAILRAGPELCGGGPGDASGHWAWGMMAVGVALGLAGVFRGASHWLRPGTAARFANHVETAENQKMSPNS